MGQEANQSVKVLSFSETPGDCHAVWRSSSRGRNRLRVAVVGAREGSTTMNGASGTAFRPSFFFSFAPRNGDFTTF